MRKNKKKVKRFKRLRARAARISIAIMNLPGFLKAWVKELLPLTGEQQMAEKPKDEQSDKDNQAH